MDEQTAVEIGVEGYVYLYPLALMDVTRKQMTNVAKLGDAPLRGPMDTFVHVPAFPPGPGKVQNAFADGSMFSQRMPVVRSVSHPAGMNSGTSLS